MSLRYKIKRVQRFLPTLNDERRALLEGICGRIAGAERALGAAAAEALRTCRRCGGLCCRNVYPDDLITLADCLYFWVRAPAARPAITAAVAGERLFSADCLFLANGVGPCLLPPHARPERCIVTFCGDCAAPGEIRRVRAAFGRLHRFYLFNLPRFFFGLRQASP